MASYKPKRYKATKGDSVDEMLANVLSIKNCEIPISRVSEGWYMFGSKKIYTKIMNNSSNAAAKLSKNAKFINKLVILQCLFQIIFATLAAIILTIWQFDQANNYEYIYPNKTAADDGFGVLICLNLGVWFI